MADKVTIELIKVNDGQWGKMYSAKASNGEWYSFGKKEPPQEGSYVEIEWEANGKYKKVRSVTRLAATDAPRTGVSVAQGSRSNGISKDDYWTRREERDVETQKRIELQSCRNSAIEMVSLLLTANAVPVPKKANEQEGYIADLVQYYANRFKDQNSDKQTNDVVGGTEDSGLPETDSDDSTDTTDWN